MIKQVLENFFSPPATRSFPREVRTPPAEVRGAVEFVSENCTFCTACALKCPTDAITVDRKAQTLDFDVFRCIGCNCCAEACKKGCVQMTGAYRGPVTEKPLLHFEAPPAPDEAKPEGAKPEKANDQSAGESTS